MKHKLRRIGGSAVVIRNWRALDKRPIDGTYRVVVLGIHVFDDALPGGFIRSFLGRHYGRISGRAMG